MVVKERILGSLNKGFIDDEVNIDEAVRTKFLTNDRSKNLTVLESIQNELRKCLSFTFSVAFITESGLNELKTIFYDLSQKGISGRIITSNYLSFNNPKVYKELLKIENVEVRISETEGFHAKGYLFEQIGYSTLVLGSSNLTSSALKINHEWNLKVSSLLDGEIIKNISNTIEATWNESIPLTQEWIDQFELEYVENKQHIQLDHIIFNEPNDYKIIAPNKMQRNALVGIEEVRNNGEDKALLVSATGTGKTYLAAFDVRKVQPKKFLFIVHREQILRDAVSSFQNVLKNDSDEYGLLTGNQKDIHAKYLFTTIQSMSREENLKQFDQEYFDYIVIDEVHKSGAPSYQKVMDYFKPKFLLGMTATPERTDNINIYEFFDYNIAYEIRLQEAIEENMICPFHYFGVTEYIEDGEVKDDAVALKYLVSNERIDHLITKMEYYSHSGKQVKGLIFTSRIDEAKEVSHELNERGYKTTYLTGDHSVSEREDAIERLKIGDLEYIITVDIFNEGIDIPFVNQVVMLRETQSSIIFIQQLGRGLRLHPGKEFVTIIDFIGNYKNNYMIPMALSGDTSFNEDILRRKTIDTSYISGISSVNFEQIAKERVFNSISTSKLSSISNLKKEYQALKNKLGHIPMLSDFYNERSVDPVIIGNAKKSYYTFLLSYDKEYEEMLKDNYLSDDHVKSLELFTREFLNGKRLHDVTLIEYLMHHESTSFEQLEKLYRSMNLYYSDKTIPSVIAMLDLSFYISTTRKNYTEFPIIKVNDNNIVLSQEFIELLTNKVFKNFLVDVLKTTKKVATKYNKSQRFTVGQLYTRRDVAKILEWGSDISGTIFGYSIRDGECPIFVTYNKVDVEHGIDYKDGFINTNTFRWYTRNKLTTHSEEVKNIIESVERDITLSLFVKKDDSTYDTNFYYLGEMNPIKDSEQDEVMDNGQSVVRIDMKINESLEEKFYDYLTE